MKMTDSEKLALIDRMIADFWEWNETAERNVGAIHVLNAISSVLEFEGKD